MLCQFTVKNYKSIKAELTLDMQAVAITDHANSIITNVDGESFLPLAALYGPNGGGKSNVLSALKALLLKITMPIYAAAPEENYRKRFGSGEIIPYAFCETSKNAPTEFELFFRTKEAEYAYYLHVLNQEVLYENLKRKKLTSTKYADIFIRSKTKVELKSALKNIKINDIGATLPVLSRLAITNGKNAIVKDIEAWLRNGIEYADYGDMQQERLIMVSISREKKDMLLKMMKEMDLSIDDYEIEDIQDSERSRVRIFTVHKTDLGETQLNINEESSGTKKLFSVLPVVLNSLIDGSTLIIDELDAKIHPQLLRYLIELYNDPKKNKHGAQLIFTSHDLSTMTSELFRRDEIWFVSKGNQQDTQMYSLVEIKNDDGKTIRKDARFDKQYLEGKYGADPYLQRIINWEEIDA